MVKIIGYIDSLGLDVVNGLLLVNCVSVMCSYFVDCGVVMNCISIDGCGLYELVVDNNMVVGWVMNCCVEIFVVELVC